MWRIETTKAHGKINVAVRSKRTGAAYGWYTPDTVKMIMLRILRSAIKHTY